MNELHERLKKGIEEHGHMVVHVMDENDPDESFIYTVGNVKRGLPELILVGNFDPNHTGRILNDMTTKMLKEERSIEPGDVDINWTYPMRVRKASDLTKDTHTIASTRIAGHDDYDVFQVMVCDTEGRYPDDEGVDDDFAVSML